MAQVYISMGSNIEPVTHLRAALDELRGRYGQVRLSSVYESPAIGFEGENFYNLVAGFETTESPRELRGVLRDIEQRNGRRRGEARFSSRTLDLDLILYDDLCLEQADFSLPRDEILKYAFVLAPLAELIPEARHPLTGRDYAELWASFDHASQPLWPVAVTL